jgi:hypothetical protein
MQRLENKVYSEPEDISNQDVSNEDGESLHEGHPGQS